MIKTILTLCLLLCLTACAYPQEAPTVALALGQSNAARPLVAGDVLPTDFPANLRLFIRQQEVTSWSQLQVIGPFVSFAMNFCAANPGRQLVLMVNAWGGTSLAKNWNPDGPGHLFRISINNVKTVLQGLGLPLHVDYILWGQGEADAQDLSTAMAYRNNLVYFVRRLRLELASPAAAFIYALTGPPNPAWQVVAKSQKEADIENSAPVSTAGLPLLDQEVRIHFTSEGHWVLGMRMWQALDLVR